MQLTTLAGQLFTQFWWIIPLLILKAFLSSAYVKGALGERKVNRMIRRHLDTKNYRLFKNVTIPTHDEGTTQIDHVIVSPYGIFVVETKNMSGVIDGSERQRNWHQMFFRKYVSFQNPLHQNFKHTLALAHLLDINNAKLISVIAFVGRSRFKFAMPANVVDLYGLVPFINGYTQPILSDSELIDICDKLSARRLKSSIGTHVKHVKHVKEIVEKKQQVNTTDNQCPQCGKPMVLRAMQAGEHKGREFWGCSGFPECWTVKPLI